MTFKAFKVSIVFKITLSAKVLNYSVYSVGIVLLANCNFRVHHLKDCEVSEVIWRRYGRAISAVVVDLAARSAVLVYVREGVSM